MRATCPADDGNVVPFGIRLLEEDAGVAALFLAGSLVLHEIHHGRQKIDAGKGFIDDGACFDFSGDVK